MRTLRAAVVVLTLIVTVASAAVSQPLQPLVVDWPQYFRIESESSTRDGRGVVKGTVWNTATWSAKRIQLLVDALDAGGQVVSQRVVWLGVDLGGGAHASFEVPLPASPAYREEPSGRPGRRPSRPRPAPSCAASPGSGWSA